MITLSHLQQKLGSIYYGWWIIVAAILIQFLQSGLLVQGYSVYIPALQAEFGWSTTVLAAAFSLLQAVAGLLGPFQGWLLSRFGPRAIMRIGMLFLGVGFLAFSQITTLAAFFTVFTLMAVGFSLGGFLSLTTTVVSWFEKRRSTALAFMQLGMSLGGLALPAVAWSLTLLGWRSSSLISGLLILLVGLPLTQLIYEYPEGTSSESRKGSTIESADEPRDQKVKQRALSDTKHDFTVREALRTQAFWLLAFGHALALIVVSAINVHAVIHLSVGLGYSLPVAAGFISLMMAFTVLGQLLGGFLGDRYPKRLIAMVAMWVHTFSLLILTYASSAVMVVLFAVGHGLAWGMRGPLMQAVRADYFGRKDFPSIMGFSFLIATFGAMTGPLIAGFSADTFGNYRIGFSILAAMAFCGSSFFYLAREPQK
jgi:sugar phosphate permease